MSAQAAVATPRTASRLGAAGDPGALPSPSGVALALMRLAAKETVTTREYAALIQHDPALTGRLLQIANSPAIAPRRPVVAVSDAVMVLGFAAVRQIALALSVLEANRSGRCEAFDYTGYWSAALARALAAQMLAARARAVAPEEAFACALLADIGRLALASVHPQRYTEIITAAGAGTASECDAEREAFGIDHDALTIELLAEWGLPDVMLEALRLLARIGAVPSVDESRAARYAHQLALASEMARYCTAGFAARHTALEAMVPRARAHLLDAAALDDFVAELSVQWRDWGQLLQVDTGDVPCPTAVQAQISADRTAAVSLPGLRILVVDDDLLLLARLRKDLEAAGHHVRTCTDGEQALRQMLEEQPPQIVITDWQMEPMDGIALCRALRATTFGQRIYVIMLTAADTEDALVTALEAGADDFVVKPLSRRVLEARVRAASRIIHLGEQILREAAEQQRKAAELAIANRRLELSVRTDALTGLPNRRYVIERLDGEWNAARRHKRPLSVIMCDADYFKDINDRHGHASGDSALSHLAGVLRNTVRASDIVARYGGEEFLILCPATTLTQARNLAERVRAAVQLEQPPDLALPRPLTVSLGVATSEADTRHWESLVAQADDALYHAKKCGRNRVSTFAETP